LRPCQNASKIEIKVTLLHVSGIKKIIQDPAEKPTTFGTLKNNPKISQIKTLIAKTQRHKITYYSSVITS